MDSAESWLWSLPAGRQALIKAFQLCDLRQVTSPSSKSASHVKTGLIIIVPISRGSCVCVCVHVHTRTCCVASVVSDSLRPLWTVAHQAPLSMEFSRQEYWSGVPCPPPGDLLDPGIEPASHTSPALAGGFFTTGTIWDAPCGSYKD